MRYDQILAAIQRGVTNMGQRCDANETAFFARELENLIAKNYEVLYGPNAYSQFMPMDTSGSPVDEIRTYRQFDWRGKAKVLSHWESSDFETVEVQGQEFSQGYFSLGSSYKYTYQELKASAQVGRSLDQMRAVAARKTIENKIDEIACIGSSEGAKAATGIANASGVSSVTISTAWDAGGKTVPQIVSDVLGANATIITDTLGNYAGNTMLLPLTTYSTLATKRTGVENTRSALVELAAAFPGLRILPWTRLEDPNGAGKRGILLANTPDVLQMLMTVPFEQFAPQQEGMTFAVRCHARVGGVCVRVPQAIKYLDGL